MLETSDLKVLRSICDDQPLEMMDLYRDGASLTGMRRLCIEVTGEESLEGVLEFDFFGMPPSIKLCSSQEHADRIQTQIEAWIGRLPM